MISRSSRGGGGKEDGEREGGRTLRLLCVENLHLSKLEHEALDLKTVHVNNAFLRFEKRPRAIGLNC